MKLLDDSSWTAGRGPRLLQIALATFSILALELALIRWISGQIRVLAYFNNLILIACFLGMGLGLVLGRRRPGLMHLTLPSLALLCVPFAFSDSIHLMHMSFPDPSVSLWGTESSSDSTVHFLSSLMIIVVLFSAIAAVFACAGAAVGHLFAAGENVSAYSADLLGSLAGVAVMTVTSTLNSSPPVWLLVGCLPLLWLSRRWYSVVGAVAVIAMGQYSVQGALFSPYNRIDISEQDSEIKLSVNRDFHQFILDLSNESVPRKVAAGDAKARQMQRVYDLPFNIDDTRGSALVIGAGTGNDVAAALRNGYRRVVSVDIDGRIIEIGRRLHPERPYDDARVVPVVNDGRAFLAQSDELFDTVCFGLVDSHAMFGALSSLRLDNYMYTEEGLRAAWAHVAPGGHMTVDFSVFAGRWIEERLYYTIAQATGQTPTMARHGMQFATSFIVGRDPARLHLDRLSWAKTAVGKERPASVETTSDDWPFLYIRPGVIPWGYLFVLGSVLLLAWLSTRAVFGQTGRKEFDTTLFLMGAAFLLIETRGVTSMSVMFGSTWIVNAAVFSGVLVVALLANLLVTQRRDRRLGWWFAFLLASVAVVWLIPPASLNSLPLVTRGAIGAVICALPVGFAGVIVSTLLARSQNLSASLASNLVGSVLGGCLEYLSMAVGLQALALLAMVIYLLALLTFMRREVAVTAMG